MERVRLREMRNDLLALGAACSLPFNALLESPLKRGCTNDKVKCDFSPKEMTRGLLGKWRLSGSWLATVWHEDGCDVPEYIRIRGLMLRLIFPLFRWQENSWSFAVDRRSLLFLRAADHHHHTMHCPFQTRHPWRDRDYRRWR